MKTADDKGTMLEYMRDESRRSGNCEKIFFPTTEEEVISILKENPHTPVTFQGGRTGVTAGCVPDGGITVNLERMNRILTLTPREYGGSIIVQPGVLLQTLRQHLRPCSLFFPPDPTETTASLGGMVSCNSSGARSFKYGSVRGYITALRIILPGGEKLHLKRGACLARGRHFSLTCESGKRISGVLPHLTMPAVKKHTAGYYIRPDMDMIDLFIGAEGTLGAVTSIELKLLPVKKETWGAVIFLPDEAAALRLVRILRGETDLPLTLEPEALEYFNSDTLRLLRRAQNSKEALCQMELLPAEDCCALYTEYASDDRESLKAAFEATCSAIESVGGDPFRTWAAINSRNMDKLHQFRHAAPECVNTRISEIKKDRPSVTKLGTDMSVPDHCLEEVMSLYNEGLAAGGFDSVIFGHIGSNHVHVNIIPRTEDEFHRGKELFGRWAKDVAAMGGTVCAEHGVGKIKTALLTELYAEEQLASMRDLKKIFDPGQLLNRGNIFSFLP